jgi:hypothetical protein
MHRLRHSHRSLPVERRASDSLAAVAWGMVSRGGRWDRCQVMRDSGWMRNASTPALGSSASSKRTRNERGGTQGGDISSLPGVCEVSVRRSSEPGEYDERSIDDDRPRTVSNSQVLSRTPVRMLGRLCQVYRKCK